MKGPGQSVRICVHGKLTLFIFNRVLFPTQQTPPKIAELFSGPKGKAVLHRDPAGRFVATRATAADAKGHPHTHTHTHQQASGLGGMHGRLA